MYVCMYVCMFWVTGHFPTPPENWTVRAFLQLTPRLSNDFTAAWLTFTFPQLFAVAATLKSIDYNVAMTFILNNNNNNRTTQFNTRPHDIQHTVDKWLLSDMESLRRKLDFLLLMHTEGSGKLNIFMQLVATLDLVLNIFTNAPTTTYSKDLKSADERGHASRP